MLLLDGVLDSLPPAAADAVFDAAVRAPLHQPALPKAGVPRRAARRE